MPKRNNKQHAPVVKTPDPTPTGGFTSYAAGAYQQEQAIVSQPYACERTWWRGEQDRSRNEIHDLRKWCLQDGLLQAEEHRDGKWYVQDRSRNEIHDLRKWCLQDGLLQAEEHRDGKWYVQVNHELVEVQGAYFCPHCFRDLRESCLQAHLESAEHKKNMNWKPAPLPQDYGYYSSMNGNSAGGAYSDDQEWYNWDPSEPWVERDSDGYWRCVPCGKMIDQRHLATPMHKRKVEDFMYTLRPVEERYPDPPEEFLAWVPVDEAQQGGERWLKCILCQKWVNDEWSHGILHGSKEHVKNMENHFHPRSEWYLQNVPPLKRLYSTGKRAAHWMSTSAGAQSLRALEASPQKVCQPPPPKVCPPWQVVWSEADCRYYFWNEETKAVQWEIPSASQGKPAQILTC